MSHPSHEEIAKSLGIKTAEVHRLSNRGMPTSTVSKARAWFEDNGFRSVGHNTPHGVRIQRQPAPKSR